MEQGMKEGTKEYVYFISSFSCSSFIGVVHSCFIFLHRTQAREELCLFYSPLLMCIFFFELAFIVIVFRFFILVRVSSLVNILHVSFLQHFLKGEIVFIMQRRVVNFY